MEEVSLLKPKKLEYDLYSYRHDVVRLGRGILESPDKYMISVLLPKYRTFYRDPTVGSEYFRREPGLQGFTRTWIGRTYATNPDQHEEMDADNTILHEVAHLECNTGDEIFVRYLAKYRQATGKKPHPYMNSCSC